MTTVTISLPESLKTFIDEQLATKGYGNVSEYFRSLLRAAQEREEEARLETLLVEGLAAGGNDIPLTRQFWSDLKTKEFVKIRHQTKRKGPHHPTVSPLPGGGPVGCRKQLSRRRR
jgi:antitoxin ParD1/3/4